MMCVCACAVRTTDSDRLGEGHEPARVSHLYRHRYRYRYLSHASVHAMFVANPTYSIPSSLPGSILRPFVHAHACSTYLHLTSHANVRITHGSCSAPPIWPPDKLLPDIPRSFLRPIRLRERRLRAFVDLIEPLPIGQPPLEPSPRMVKLREAGAEAEAFAEGCPSLFDLASNVLHGATDPVQRCVRGRSPKTILHDVSSLLVPMQLEVAQCLHLRM